LPVWQLPVSASTSHINTLSVDKVVGEQSVVEEQLVELKVGEQTHLLNFFLFLPAPVGEHLPRLTLDSLP
jgi:hypothetical protein